MRSTAEAIPPETSASAVTVALLGQRVPSAPALGGAMAALYGPDRTWSIAEDGSFPAGTDPKIVVCDAELVGIAIGRWPDASPLAVVPDRGQSTAVVLAIDHGANLCVQAEDVEVVAAFVHALARRRAKFTGRAEQ